MPEDTAPADAPATPSADAPTTPTPVDGGGKTFTQAELDAIVNARISKAEKAARKTWEAEQAEAKRKADQTLEQRYAELEAQLKAKDAEVETARREAADRIALAGKVIDVDYAVWRANQDPEKYRGDDGALNVAKLLEDHPALNAAPTPKPGPAPTPAGGNPDFGRTGMNHIIRQKAGRA